LALLKGYRGCAGRPRTISQRADQVHVHPGGVADEADDRLLMAPGTVRFKPHAVQPIEKVFQLRPIGFFLEDDDHA
jgi:hypothetical protein